MITYTNYGIIHWKTCQGLREIVLYILNTPGKAWKQSWKTRYFFNYDGLRALYFDIDY